MHGLAFFMVLLRMDDVTLSAKQAGVVSGIGTGTKTVDRTYRLDQSV
jgi:hypothetical protein